MVKPIGEPGRRWAPMIGLGFAVFFLGSVAASSVPGNNAPDKDWVAAYAHHGEQVRHLATGVCLILAALCLLSFLTLLWNRIAAAQAPEPVSRVPLVAARVAAASIIVGGISMGGVSTAMLIGAVHKPSVHLLRFGNGFGFVMVAIPGMLAAALSVARLSGQARSAGLFGKKLMIFGLVVSVVLLGAVLFVPIAALLIWLIVVSITMIRRDVTRPRTDRPPALSS
jgi:hypothetical protein